MRQEDTELVEWDDWEARLREGDWGDGEDVEDGTDDEDASSGEDGGAGVWDATARRTRLALGRDDFPLGYPWHPDDECLADVEDALVDAIDVDRALALLPAHRRELFQLLLGAEEVEEAPCPPPRTFAEIGRYLGWKYRGVAYSATTMWRWYQESLALWRSLYGRPRPRPCQPEFEEVHDTVASRDARTLRKAA